MSLRSICDDDVCKAAMWQMCGGGRARLRTAIVVISLTARCSRITASPFIGTPPGETGEIFFFFSMQSVTTPLLRRRCRLGLWREEKKPQILRARWPPHRTFTFLGAPRDDRGLDGVIRIIIIIIMWLIANKRCSPRTPGCVRGRTAGGDETRNYRISLSRWHVIRRKM